MPILPKIHDVSWDDKQVRYVFTIPNGLDPAKLQKKWYCFQQMLGRNIDMEGDIKKFVLTVYNPDVNLQKPYNYKYEDVKPILAPFRLPIFAGKDKNGEWVIFDLLEHPHLLLAGETGSGKSSMIRVILSTIIKHMNPEDIRLYLGDLKRSEFHFLRNVAHVEKVCMDEISLESMLMNINQELINRGNTLDQHELAHVDEYNKLNPSKKLSYILVCIDEVAMLQGEKDIMKIIEKISAIGRALGVFLLLSMQRPDKDVLDGKLKNNMTVRMGFQCADDINARIIGTPGAESLTQAGSMLLKIKGLTQIQAPYLDLEKAKAIVKPYKVKNQPKQEQPEKQQETVFGVLDDENER